MITLEGTAPDEFLRKYRERALRAMRDAVAGATEQAKEDARSAIRAAGFSARFSNMLGSRVYPRTGLAYRPAGELFARGRQAENMLRAFGEGAVIKGKDGGYLAIPTAAARGRWGGKTPTPASVERASGLRLRMVYQGRGKPALLVTDGARLNSRGRAVAAGPRSRNRQAGIVMFVLVPRVTLRKRFDIRAAVARAAAGIPNRIAAAMRIP